MVPNICKCDFDDFVCEQILLLANFQLHVGLSYKTSELNAIGYLLALLVIVT